MESNFLDKLNDFSFTKIDTEGYDKEIIKSIHDLIEKYKPTIVAESFGDSTNEEKIELYDVIAQHGYEIFYFEDFDVTAEIIKLDNSHEITNCKKTINVYAVPVSLMQRSALEKIGIWDERLQFADFDLFFRTKERSMQQQDIKPIQLALGVYLTIFSGSLFLRST